MDKASAADQKILEKAAASGTIVGYGDDVNMIHQPDGSTHDNWWSAMSMAGVLNVLDQMYKSGTPTVPSWLAPRNTGITFTSTGITTGIPDRAGTGPIVRDRWQHQAAGS